MSASLGADTSSFDRLYNHLRSCPPPLLLPSALHDKSITHRISDLFVHPALEAALHILNHDLPSAHFLVRHMQAAPQHEGMFLHGILHRIEGDYDNARAWYGDVAGSQVFACVWGRGGLEKAREFIQCIQDLRNEGSRCDEENKRALGRESLQEIEKVVEFCRAKFGTDKYEEVSDVWTQPTEGKVKDMKENMITGDKGLRKF